MRNSLFWRILIVSSILLFILCILINKNSDGFILLDYLNQNIAIILVIIGLLVIGIFLIAKQYIQPIRDISDHINDSEKLSRSFYKTKLLPVELQKLYKAILDFQSKDKEKHNSFLADEKIFSSVLSNMNDGILVSDQNGDVSLINRAACQIFNISQSEALGHSLVEVIRHFKMNELLEQTIASQSLQSADFETAPEKTFIHCIAAPLGNELPGNILFLLQDLTRVRQLEIIRKDFVSNVSHELRTPLTSLKLITETLQEGLLEDPAEAKTFLNRMNSEVDNLTQMVEELLELSKIESGKVPLDKHWIKPDKLIKSAGERMALQAERAGLTFHAQPAADLADIFVDKSRLERVLVNLLHNAIKFTQPGGKVELSAYQEKNEIIFYVKDSGVGIPPKDLDRIFERFYKLDRSRSESGTGLGLSISRHLVEAHGGKIWAESQINQGSTFFFSIPIN